MRWLLLAAVLGLTSCASLSTNRGIKREAYQRRLFDSAYVKLDTVIVVERQVEIDTLLQGTVDYLVDTLLLPSTDTLRLRYTVRVPYAVRFTDTLTVRDTVRIDVGGFAPVPEAPSKSPFWLWVGWILFVLLAAAIAWQWRRNK
jgi:hypothetical protein